MNLEKKANCKPPMSYLQGIGLSSCDSPPINKFDDANPVEILLFMK